jgi:hypothetical protein
VISLGPTHICIKEEVIRPLAPVLLIHIQYRFVAGTDLEGVFVPCLVDMVYGFGLN